MGKSRRKGAESREQSAKQHNSTQILHLQSFALFYLPFGVDFFTGSQHSDFTSFDSRLASRSSAGLRSYESRCTLIRL